MADIPFLKAAAAGDLPSLKILHTDAAITVVDTDGKCALHYAAEAGQLETIEWLLSVGFDIDVRTKKGGTPFLFAVFRGQRAAADLLLSKGANFYTTDDLDRNCLHLACVAGREQEMKWLLQEKKFNVQSVNSKGMTCAHFLAMSGHTKLLEWYLAFAKETLANETTSLDTTSDAKPSLTFDQLLNAQTSDGFTPLYVSAVYKQKDVLRLLLNHGADATTPDTRGTTPLHVAVRSLTPATTRYLLLAGASASAKDATGLTPLELLSRTRVPPERQMDADTVREYLATALAPPAAPSIPGIPSSLDETIRILDAEFDPALFDRHPGKGTRTAVPLTWTPPAQDPLALPVTEYQVQVCAKPTGAGAFFAALNLNWTDATVAVEADSAASDGNETAPSKTATAAPPPHARVIQLTPGTSYYFRVRAKNANGWGAFSGKSAEIATAPAAAAGTSTPGTETPVSGTPILGASSGGVAGGKEPRSRAGSGFGSTSSGGTGSAPGTPQQAREGPGVADVTAGSGAVPGTSAGTAPIAKYASKYLAPTLSHEVLEMARKGDLTGLKAVARRCAEAHANASRTVSPRSMSLVAGSSAASEDESSAADPWAELLGTDPVSGDNLVHIAVETENADLLQWVVGRVPPAVPTVTPPPLPPPRAQEGLYLPLDVPNAEGMTPLLLAAQQGALAFVQLLAQRRVSLDTAAPSGNAAIHFAAANNHVALFRWLCEAGCNISTPNAAGLTPKAIVLANKASGADAATTDTLLAILANATGVPPAPPTPLLLQQTRESITYYLPPPSWTAGTPVPFCYEFQWSKSSGLSALVTQWATLTDRLPAGIDVYQMNPPPSGVCAPDTLVSPQLLGGYPLSPPNRPYAPVIITLPTLAPDTRVSVQVRVRNGNGLSAWSAASGVHATRKATDLTALSPALLHYSIAISSAIRSFSEVLRAVPATHTIRSIGVHAGSCITGTLPVPPSEMKELVDSIPELRSIRLSDPVTTRAPIAAFYGQETLLSLPKQSAPKLGSRELLLAGERGDVGTVTKCAELQSIRRTFVSCIASGEGTFPKDLKEVTLELLKLPVAELTAYLSFLSVVCYAGQLSLVQWLLLQQESTQYPHAPLTTLLALEEIVHYLEKNAKKIPERTIQHTFTSRISSVVESPDAHDDASDAGAIEATNDQDTTTSTVDSAGPAYAAAAEVFSGSTQVSPLSLLTAACLGGNFSVFQYLLQLLLSQSAHLLNHNNTNNNTPGNSGVSPSDRPAGVPASGLTPKHPLFAQFYGATGAVGSSPGFFHLAALGGSLACAQLLYDLVAEGYKEAVWNAAVAPWNWTPLFFAVAGGSLETVEYFVSIAPHGTDLAACVDIHGRNLLHIASTLASSFPLLRYLCETLGNNALACQDKGGMTPMHFGAATGNALSLSFLLWRARFLPLLKRPTSLIDEAGRVPIQVAREAGEIARSTLSLLAKGWNEEYQILLPAPFNLRGQWMKDEDRVQILWESPGKTIGLQKENWDPIAYADTLLPLLRASEPVIAEVTFSIVSISSEVDGNDGVIEKEVEWKKVITEVPIFERPDKSILDPISCYVPLPKEFKPFCRAASRADKKSAVHPHVQLQVRVKALAPGEAFDAGEITNWSPYSRRELLSVRDSV